MRRTGTPSAVIDKVAHDVAEIARDRAFAELLAVQGAVPAILPPAQFASFVQGESRKFSRIVREAGVKAD